MRCEEDETLKIGVRLRYTAKKDPHWTTCPVWVFFYVCDLVEKSQFPRAIINGKVY